MVSKCLIQRTEKQNIMENRSSIFMALHFFAAIAGWSLPSGAAGSGTG